MLDPQSGGAAPAALDLDALPVVTPNRAALDRHSIVGFDDRDIRARPFNLLRTQLAKRIAADGLKVIGITSATPAAGKSFVSLNLAAALARLAGLRTVLLDLDLRRASVADGLGLDITNGLSDYLAGEIDDLNSLGARVEGTNMTVFPTREVRDSSTELLASERLGSLIETFRDIDDNLLVLCDMPPAFANDDAMITVQKLDGYVMIVDSGQTTRRQVEETVEMLKPTPCVGTILNRYKGGIIDAYGYGYGGHAYNKYY